MAKSSVAIEKINALAELEALKIKAVPAGGDEVRVCCPVHEDKTASATMNVKNNLWKCHAASCGASGDVISYMAFHVGVGRREIIADLMSRYDLGTRKVINIDTVEKYHSRLMESDNPLKTALYSRGVTNELIRKARLGFDGDRITIPVFDKEGNVVNIRRYMPGAPGPKKMRNTASYNKLDLYLIDQVQYDAVWICGGEMKALVASSFLNPLGIGAVAVTGGEGAWNFDHTKMFNGKRVYVCMDVDAGGTVASRRVASHLILEAQSVYIVHLPLDKAKHPKGDVNDWVAKEGAGTAEFESVMASATRFFLQDDAPSDIETIETTLHRTADTGNVGKRLVFDATIMAMDTTPYIVAKDIGVSCTRDQPNCSHCPVRPKEPDPDTGIVQMTISATSAGVLDMVNAPKKSQESAIMGCLKIPSCKAITISIKTTFNVYDVRLTPQLTEEGDNKDHVVQPAMVVTDDQLELNQPYTFQGRVFPHPKTQQAVLLLDSADVSADALTVVTIEGEALEPLKVFRPAEWTEAGIKAKLGEVYEDMASNVTRIFHRQELHLALDLTWHSALFFDFDGQRHNGWVNCLIAGDSSQGKSETTQRLIRHYHYGVRHDCKNATSAGLLGGLQQLGNRWFVSWGVIPQHDRRLVILEEIKGAPVETIGALTDMRSSGVAEITKIEKRRAHARTRLVMISNPRSDRPISAFNFGVEAIKELIGTMEDIRRFDLAVLVSSSQVNIAEINQMSSSRKSVPHVYESDLCKKRILWAWTRSPDQIKFDDDALDACLKRAVDLCSTFSEALPLCDRGTMRYKLARLAISLAVMTFSTEGEEYDTVVVRKCHVDFVSNFIKKLYGDKVFGYLDFSKAMEFANSIIDPHIIRKNLLSQKFPSDLVDHLLHSDDVQAIDLCDWCDLSRDDAQSLLSTLVRKHALYREKRWYRKTPEFIQLLKDMKAKGIPKAAETIGHEI